MAGLRPQFVANRSRTFDRNALPTPLEYLTGRKLLILKSRAEWGADPQPGSQGRRGETPEHGRKPHRRALSLSRLRGQRWRCAGPPSSNHRSELPAGRPRVGGDSMNAGTSEAAKDAARRLAAPMHREGIPAAGITSSTTPPMARCCSTVSALKHPETGDKWIRPMKLNGQGYELGEPKFSDGKPLYGLPRIASNLDVVVWVVEGEQKADALNKLGLVATTSGGSQSAAVTDWGPLRGRTVQIWPDNDDPGKAYADEVARILQRLGCAVSCVDVAALGLPDKGDAVDWLQARPGAVADDVEALQICRVQLGGNERASGLSCRCLARSAFRRIHRTGAGALALGRMARTGQAAHPRRRSRRR